MYKHILVTVGFDTEHDAEQSLRVAKVLADENTRTTVLHVNEVIPGYVVTYMPENYDVGVEKELLAKLKGLANQLDNGVGVLIEGHSGRTIVDWAEANDVDCITSRRIGRACKTTCWVALQHESSGMHSVQCT